MLMKLESLKSYQLDGEYNVQESRNVKVFSKKKEREVFCIHTDIQISLNFFVPEN